MINYSFYKDWFYIEIGNKISINVEINPFKTMSKLKGIFLPLKCKFYHGYKNNLKNDNMYLWNRHNKWIDIQIHDIKWKDKYATPRYEDSPIIAFTFFGYTIYWTWELYPHWPGHIDEYWEQALWYLYYYSNISQSRLDKPNIFMARKSWPWKTINNFNDEGQSSWKDEYLNNNIRKLL